MGGGRKVAASLNTAMSITLPMLPQSSAGYRMRPALRWTLHVVVLVVALGLLWLLQRWLDLDRHLQLPHTIFRGYWLPLIMVLAYALAWNGRWLWDGLGPGQELAMFPEIDRAWSDAVAALDQAGIDLTASPVFLVLGRPQGGEHPLFESLHPRTIVNGVPGGPDAPLRVYANRDGIYITCPGTSHLSHLAMTLAEETFVASEAHAGDMASPGDSGRTGTAFGTLQGAATPRFKDVQDILDRAKAMGREPGQLNEEERRAIGRIMASHEEEGDDPRAAMLRDRGETEALSLRLRAVCHHIARDRRPYCPINGILMVFPLAATQSDPATVRAGFDARRDLEVVHDTLQIRCPIIALVSDLETLRGFRELMARMPQDQRVRRMGQRFPLKPDADLASLATMFDGGIQQVGNRLIPNLVSSLWRVESLGGETVMDAVRGNTELYHLLNGIRGRQARIARLVARAALPEFGTPAPVGGCYLAATGSDAAHEQAFLPGILRRLVESQDFVSWTPKALAEDRNQHRWSRIGYITLALVVAASIGYFVFVFWQSLGTHSPTP